MKKRSNCCYVHHPEKLPEIFVTDKFFIFNEEIHDYNTRNKSNIIQKIVLD